MQQKREVEEGCECHTEVDKAKLWPEPTLLQYLQYLLLQRNSCHQKCTRKTSEKKMHRNMRHCKVNMVILQLHSWATVFVVCHFSQEICVLSWNVLIREGTLHILLRSEHRCTSNKLMNFLVKNGFLFVELAPSAFFCCLEVARVWMIIVKPRVKEQPGLGFQNGLVFGCSWNL